MAQYDITLLYVEDDAETAASMKVILEDYFQNVLVAYTAMQALKLFQKYDIDIVLSDIELPDFSGLELVDKLKRINEKLVVIMFSAYDERDYLLKAIDVSVCGYLIKPFHLERFDQTIARCMKNFHEMKTRYLAYIDQLTNIYNRHKIVDVFHAFKRQEIPFGFIIMDIDDFKRVNDTYGHNVGDAVLRRLAKFVKSQIRQDDYFGRWGGEEFVLLLPNIDRPRLLKKASDLRLRLSKHHFDKVGHITVSMGVGLYDNEETIEQLVERVDNALYKAKKNGKNRVETG